MTETTLGANAPPWEFWPSASTSPSTGCVDHREGIAYDETHALFTRLMDESRAMLWGRVTYER